MKAFRGPRSFPSEMERFSDATDGGWQCEADLSATMVVVPSEGTKHIGGCSHVKRMEDVYAELGLYEAQVEGIRSSNSVLIG